MKKISIYFLIVTVIFSCTKKATPAKIETLSVNKEATISKPPVDEPIVNVAPSAEQITAGIATYVAKCVKCHALPVTTDYTSARWVGIVGWMAPKAKLSDDEKKNVLAYVQSNAKK